MKLTFATCQLVTLAFAGLALCQDAPRSAPLYRVTVVERSVDAVNYQYRSGPTKIDFKGTVLLANGKGNATVESHRGRTEIDAGFEHLVAPTRFGREYLTYVLWAISPEGAPHNLGEVVADGSDHGHLRVTTELQVFGLIVTAEPHSAVRQPSDVVVLENEVRPDTIGRTQPIQAKYELMPRGQYTWQVPDNLENSVNAAPKVSMDRYESILEVYEAQNAVQIAMAAQADKYAPNTFDKAQKALAEANRLQSIKANPSLIVQNAREAAQTAEDARVIAEKDKQAEELAKAQSEVLQAQQAKARAEAAAQQARADADTARAQAQAERAARQQAEAQASLAQQPVVQEHADRVTVTEPVRQESPQVAETGLRIQLFERLNGVLASRDTPRGLVVTVPNSGFSGASLHSATASEVTRVAAILAAQPGLRVAVEGNWDTSPTSATAGERAAAVRNALISAGLPANEVSIQGLGDTRPLVSNATEEGRLENRRVEIVISGAPIGTLPFWDRTYKLARP
jgi:flagellar motor protein MotB